MFEQLFANSQNFVPCRSTFAQLVGRIVQGAFCDSNVSIKDGLLLLAGRRRCLKDTFANIIVARIMKITNTLLATHSTIMKDHSTSCNDIKDG